MDNQLFQLRAYGAFLVSAELKDGHVGSVENVSEKGRRCTIQDNFGAPVRVYDMTGGNVSVPFCMADGNIIFDTLPGRVYAVEVEI